MRILHPITILEIVVSPLTLILAYLVIEWLYSDRKMILGTILIAIAPIYILSLERIRYLWFEAILFLVGLVFFIWKK